MFIMNRNKTGVLNLDLVESFWVDGRFLKFICASDKEPQVFEFFNNAEDAKAELASIMMEYKKYNMSRNGELILTPKVYEV